MQINLSDTNHTLELVTSVAGSIQWTLNYIDIKTNESNIAVELQGVITTATTIEGQIQFINK